MKKKEMRVERFILLKAEEKNLISFHFKIYLNYPYFTWNKFSQNIHHFEKLSNFYIQTSHFTTYYTKIPLKKTNFHQTTLTVSQTGKKKNYN